MFHFLTTEWFYTLQGSANVTLRKANNEPRVFFIHFLHISL